MGDEAHVGLVDAHAEGDGRHHDDALFALKPCLVQTARAGVHAGVIGQRGHTLPDQPGRGLLGLAPRQAIDDTGLPRMLGAEERKQLRPGVGFFDDAIADIRPVEAGNEQTRAR